ncbi:MAG: hybrid sensor histidine kinase/response regulator [Ignavibacteriaceae bacterium]|nr:hybrid sensor histidine kinase/response regulator [Ignavibacteriaceae bacterium]HRI47795.1 hybrid sensor histidine kinase/response regulator [Ignavibacteriaceae bacterium]
MTKILIIEDEAPLREEIADWLMFENFEVFVAGNGREGIKSALENKPDLIFSDIMMPDMDGRRTLIELKANPETSMIPFVFMTALAERSEVRKGMELGADDYITKPFSREELLKTISTRLEKSKVVHKHTQKEVDSIKNRIIFHLPHELRTPLIGVLGFGQLLKEMPDSFSHEELADIGNVFVQSGLRLKHLVENYLLFTQLELGLIEKNDDARVEFISEIINTNVIPIFKNVDRTSDLEVSLQAGSIKICEEMFTKIVSELSDNCSKFSPKGTKVKIEGEINGDYYQLIFTDLGRGLTEEQINQIGAYMQFDRPIFEQQGSGLGLIIVKNILDLYSGLLEIKSKPGVETTVKIKIPLAK